MALDARRTTAAALLARRAGRAALLLVLALTALYAAVTPESLATLFPGPWLNYLFDVATLDFGTVNQIHREEWVDIATWNVYIPDRTVTAIVLNRLPSTLFLTGWTLIISGGGAVLIAGLRPRATSPTDTGTGSVSVTLVRVLSVFVVAEILVTLLNFSDRLFNFDWETLLVDTTPIIFGLRTFPDVTTVTGLIAASKWAIIPALSASTAVLPVLLRLLRTATALTDSSAAADTHRNQGATDLPPAQRRHVRLVWVLEGLPTLVAVVPIATLIAEVAVRNDVGLSRVAGAALLAGEPGLLAALLLLLVGPALLADIIREPAIYLLTGTRRSDPRSQDRFALPSPNRIHRFVTDGTPRLRPLLPPRPTGVTTRLLANPGPAITWVVGAGLLVTLQLGAVFDFLAAITGSTTIPRLPTLVSWTTIPDAAYPTPTGTAGSLFGLPQWAAWTVRILVAELYLITVLGWAWLGIRIARVIYGADDRPLIAGSVVSAIRHNRRIAAGTTVALLIVAIGLFAPATAPAMADNPTAEFADQTVTFTDPRTGEIRTQSRIVVAGTQRPTGVDNGTAGPLEYGRFGRFHPIGILLETKPAVTGGQTRDAFMPFAMRLQQLLLTVGLVVATSLIVGVLATLLAASNYRIEATLSTLAGAMTLVALPAAVAAVSRTITDAFIRVGETPSLPPSPVDQATSWLAQSIVPAHDLALAVLLAAPTVLVTRRYLHPDTADTPPPRAALRRATLPLLATMHFLAAGAIVVILVERIFTQIDPSAVLFFDVGVSIDFTWIDTALWYRNTVPIAIQLLLAGALAVVGDGIRAHHRHRPDPTSHGPTESDAGGEGA